MNSKNFMKPGSMITSTSKSTGGGKSAKSFMSSKGLKGGSTAPMRKAFTPAGASKGIKGF